MKNKLIFLKYTCLFGRKGGKKMKKYFQKTDFSVSENNLQTEWQNGSNRSSVPPFLRQLCSHCLFQIYWLSAGMNRTWLNSWIAPKGSLNDSEPYRTRFWQWGICVAHYHKPHRESFELTPMELQSLLKCK